MPDPTTTPAQTGETDLAKLQDAVNRLTTQVTNLTTAQAAQQKDLRIIVDTMAADKKEAEEAAAAAKTGDKPDDKKEKPVTLQAIEQLITEKLSATQQQHQQKAARDAHISQKLKDLPAVYQDKLGADPAKWAEEEQAIRTQFRDDLKALGVTPKNLGSHTHPGGTPPAAQPDESKMTGMELLDKAVAETGAKLVSAGEQTVAVVETAQVQTK